MKRNRIIDILRREYPRGEWRWDPEHRVWDNVEMNAFVRGEAALRMCCMDACAHYRVQYRLNIEFSGPKKVDHAWYPCYSEVILMSIRGGL